MSLLTCKDLSVGYENKIINEHINFEVNKGDILCVIGENGSGKTTLINTLLGILKPIKGTFEYSNLNKNEISYLPQFNDSQKDFPATCKEIVLSGLTPKIKFRPFFTKKEKRLCQNILAMLHMEQYLNHPFRELSGGQMQKVLIARALISQAKIIVMDEPNASLDQETVKELFKIIKHLNENHDISFILILHDKFLTESIGSHILKLGKTNEYITMKEYLKTEENL